jgi:hypothetical protein
VPPSDPGGPARHASPASPWNPVPPSGPAGSAHQSSPVNHDLPACPAAPVRPGTRASAARTGRPVPPGASGGRAPGTQYGSGVQRDRRRTGSCFPGRARRRAGCGPAAGHGDAGGLWSLRTLFDPLSRLILYRYRSAAPKRLLPGRSPREPSPSEMQSLPRGGALFRHMPEYERAVKHNGANDAGLDSALGRRVRLPATAVQPVPAWGAATGMRSKRVRASMGPPETSAFGPLQSEREHGRRLRDVRLRNAPPGPRYRQPPGTPLACLFSGPSSSPSSHRHRGRLERVPEGEAGDSAGFISAPVRAPCNVL